MYKVLVLAVFLVVLAVPSGFAGTVAVSQDAQLLYVVPVQSGSVEGDSLALRTDMPVLYFSDRPKRLAGHFSPSRFATLWEQDFATDPPNATLSILSEENGQRDVVVEILTMNYADGIMTAQVRVLEGQLPASFARASLFVDDTSALPDDIREQ